MVQRTTGLVVDAYFSASKIRWILDAVPGSQQRAERGELAFGTVDSWLNYRLTGGAHVTDETNASRTMLYDIHAGQWSHELLAAFDIPTALLPEVLPSWQRRHFLEYVEALARRHRVVVHRRAVERVLARAQPRRRR